MNVSMMNRDSLLNKTLSPPLSSRVPISHSNGISYSNSSLSGGQMNEPSWIPSIRGSTHSVFILKFLFDALCSIFSRVGRLLSSFVIVRFFVWVSFAPNIVFFS